LYIIGEGCYEGQFNQGLISGHGYSKYINGATYNGYMVNDQKTGEGVYTWPNGSRYAGNFILDKRSGHGEMSWINGSSYVGVWREGKENDKKGKYEYSDGRTFEGEVKDGFLHG
jgi:hypothetical protein